MLQLSLALRNVFELNSLFDCAPLASVMDWPQNLIDSGESVQLMPSAETLFRSCLELSLENWYILVKAATFENTRLWLCAILTSFVQLYVMILITLDVENIFAVFNESFTTTISQQQQKHYANSHKHKNNTP